MQVYGVELSFNNRESYLLLPVNPEELEVSEAGKGKLYDIISTGEINVIQDRQLTTYGMKGIFPAQTTPYVNASEPLQPPIHYILLIESWMRTKRPIRFKFMSESYDINTPASIESFQWKEAAGSGGDIEYSLSLKKYRFYEAKRYREEEDGLIEEDSPRYNEREAPKTYTMIQGDSLWKVAKTQLGDATRWGEIQQLNGISDAELRRLPVGKVLILP